MVYTRERLLKAVRDAGRDGQPFTAGAVRDQLGVKTKDKRELKRFRSAFRQVCESLGTNLERLGPNTYRLKTAGASESTARPKARPATAAAAPGNGAAEVAARSLQLDRGAQATSAKRSASAETSRVELEYVERDNGPGIGTRFKSWVDRLRGRNTASASAATALSRLALDLQPSAANFQYQCVDGDLRVRLTRQPIDRELQDQQR